MFVVRYYLGNKYPARSKQIRRSLVLSADAARSRRSRGCHQTAGVRYLSTGRIQAAVWMERHVVVRCLVHGALCTAGFLRSPFSWRPWPQYRSLVHCSRSGPTSSAGGAGLHGHGALRGSARRRKALATTSATSPSYTEYKRKEGNPGDHHPFGLFRARPQDLHAAHHKVTSRKDLRRTYRAARRRETTATGS
jgi:hypothetical protein